MALSVSFQSLGREARARTQNYLSLLRDLVMGKEGTCRSD